MCLCVRARVDILKENVKSNCLQICNWCLRTLSQIAVCCSNDKPGCSLLTLAFAGNPILTQSSIKSLHVRRDYIEEKSEISIKFTDLESLLLLPPS